MEIFGFLMTIFANFANVVDEIMWTFEDYAVYDNIVKVRRFKQGPDRIHVGIRSANQIYFQFLSSCIGNFYLLQTVATIGLCLYLRQLAVMFPPPPITTIDVSPLDVGPGIEQLLEEKETCLKEAASKNSDLEKENAELRAEVDRLKKEVDFIAKDKYDLFREKCTLQNKLRDSKSGPEFRAEDDQLTTEFEAMKRQREREHILQEKTLSIAKEAKLELEAAKRAEAISKTAHSEELKLIKQERDEAMERYQTLLTVTTTAAATVKTIQEEYTRLALDFGRMKSLIKLHCDHSASQLESAASRILSLEEDKSKAEKRVAELKEEVQEANEKAGEMEKMYMAVAFADEADEEEEEKKGEDKEEEGKEEGDLLTATTTTAATIKALQEENTRLTLALCSQKSLLSEKTSDFEHMQSLIKSGSDHSASQLESAASRILSFEEDKSKAKKRIAELKEEVQEANEKTEEMEKMYMVVAFADEADEAEEDKEEEDKEEEDKEKEDKEEEDKEEEEGEDDDGGERPSTQGLLKQMSALSKKERSEVGAIGRGSLLKAMMGRLLDYLTI